jgi:hypothetical protein
MAAYELARTERYGNGAVKAYVFEFSSREMHIRYSLKGNYWMVIEKQVRLFGKQPRFSRFCHKHRDLAEVRDWVLRNFWIEWREK